MENQSNNHYRFIIIIIFLILAVFITVLIYTKVINSPIITGNQSSKIETSHFSARPTFGSMTIKTDNNSVRQPLTNSLAINIWVDSNQADIVGYDCLLKYDSTAFEIEQVVSEQNDFSIFKFDNENRLTVTGTKKIDAQEKNIFANEKLVGFIFKPQKTGKYKFEIIPEVGKEKTQLVDTSSSIYYPKLNTIEIEIY